MFTESVIDESILTSFSKIRKQTLQLCEPLVNEDYVIQSIADVSPPKWHLAHTTWFFETFLLMHHLPHYQFFNKSFHHLFNSYYHGIGEPFPRAKRGLLARPTVNEVYQYRQYVDEHIIQLINHSSEIKRIQEILILGLQHEQQHQELLLMDIKHNFFIDPTFPVYRAVENKLLENAHYLSAFNYISAATVDIGYRGNEFYYDNESPLHQCILKSYEIADQLVTNQEYLEFIDAGGYQNPEWWLADGWEMLQKEQWQAPLYWQREEKNWRIFTLNGKQNLNLREPVAHVSFYEADAYARWRKCRLPTEAEWENYARTQAITGNFLENNYFHPKPAEKTQQFYGDLWEWTASAYLPYPGYQPFSGALGEYNGKFMSNQMVLRGGSCVTPQSHIRPSYRNFFQPEKRWQFSGIRLAREGKGR